MDYSYLQVSDGNGDAALMHVEADRSIGATTIEVDSVSNVPQLFIATYGTLLPNGKIDPETKRDFYGHLDGTNLEIDGFCPGSTDSGNTTGQVVVIKPNTSWSDLVATFIANLTGNGTPENITAAELAANDIEADNLTLAAQLAVGGSATITGNITISGTSKLVPGTTATANESGQIVPDKQVYSVTALAANATIARPTWPATDRMAGTLRIKDNGTSRTLSFPTAHWRAIGVTPPSSTGGNKWVYVSYEYCEADDRFHILGVARQA